jgi:hypothetical protein
MTSRHFRPAYKRANAEPTARRGAAVLEQLLTELAYVLLPRGMTPKRFADLAKSAFVHAAADISKTRSGRVNHSRIAAQTGVTRAVVKRLLSSKTSDAAPRGKPALEKVIDGWRTDREFLTKSGRTRPLMISGPRRSFARLVRKYGGDVPHRAVLDELLRVGVVSNCAGNLHLHHPMQLRERNNFAFLSPALPALVDGLRIVSKNAGSASSAIQRLRLPAETDVDLAVLRHRCTSSAQTMLDGLAHSLGPQITAPRRKRASAHWITITVLLAETRGK